MAAVAAEHDAGDVPSGESTPFAPVIGFEGPEKTIELDFVPGVGPAEGLRLLPRERWDSILKEAACSIMVEHRGECIDAYVLSESSLFVMARKLIVKTCGTTTLLLLLPAVLAAVDELGMLVEWLSYSRKDFLYPERQRYPHRSTAEEVAFLRKYFPDGHAHIMGPLTRDHWFIFTADRCERPPEQLQECTLNLMMYGICQQAAACFTREGLGAADPEARAALEGGGDPEGAEVCELLGRCVERQLHMDELLPGMVTQSWLFDPCGWSLNGSISFPGRDEPEGRNGDPADAGKEAADATAQADTGSTSSPVVSASENSLSSAYWTVHVTPEEHCSYVSFETNAPLRDHKPLVTALLSLFRPRRFTMTLFTDRQALRRLDSRIHDEALDTLPVFPGLAYSRLDLCATEFVGDYSVILGNYKVCHPEQKAQPTPSAEHLEACLQECARVSRRDLTQ